MAAESSLSQGQFGHLYEQALGGGFTVATSGPEAGMAPANKIMVGQRDVPEGEATSGGEIGDYAAAHAAVLGQPDRYLGGWGNKGTVFLDAPKGFDDTPTTEVAGRESTIANTQKAFGRMGPDRQYAGSTYNPYHPDFTNFDSQEMVDPDESPEANATKYFAGDERLWTRQSLNQHDLRKRR